MTTSDDSASRANPFAVNIGNLLTNRNPEQSVGEAMDALVAQRISWENNELAAAQLVAERAFLVGELRHVRCQQHVVVVVEHVQVTVENFRRKGLIEIAIGSKIMQLQTPKLGASQSLEN